MRTPTSRPLLPWLGLACCLPWGCADSPRHSRAGRTVDAGFTAAAADASSGFDAAGDALPPADASLDAPPGDGRDARAPFDGSTPPAGDGASPASDATAPLDGASVVDAQVDAAPEAGTAMPRLPPTGVGFDYQIGGGYDPPAGVAVVSRDRDDSPAPGLYNICYVNGFQIQPHEEGFWLSQHPTLILRDGSGKPVIDEDWDEMMLDVGSAAKRTQIASVVGGWIAQCAQDGFDAVEIDNLDTYDRSGGRITQDDAVAFMALLSARAHLEGLAIAQKNATDLVARRAEMGTDFVVSEECDRWNECDVYLDAYGARVFDIEYPGGGYDEGDFDDLCAAGLALSPVYRDVDVRPAGQSGYRYRACD